MENFSDIKYILDGFLLVMCGALVMWMAAGFAMLEAGLTRSKNTSTILTKNIGLYAVASLAYFFVGYNLMYGEGGAVAGSGVMLLGITNDNHSVMADFFFQVVFVATSASVISGAVAERMKMWSFFLFVIVLSAVIYPIQGHWVWGAGLTTEGGLLEGFSDFAGSTLVHSVGGWAALAAVLLLGARKGKYTKDGKVRPIPGSSMPLAALGALILWFGWFGFNGGSQLALGSKSDIDAIGLIFASTNMGASAGAVMAAILSQLIYKKIDLTMMLNGALAGLVSVTAGPNISLEVALIEGLVGGALVVFAIPLFDKLKIDDPVGALSVHLVAGIWGTLAVGIFNPDVTIIAQIKGIILIGLFVFVASFIVWFVIKKTLGLRVGAQEEYEGLDIHETGLEAYPEFVKNAK